jgi:tellurite resistance protein TerC
VSGLAELAAVGGLVILLLWIDLRLFARGREPTFREGLIWSAGWLGVSMLAAGVLWALEGEQDAVVFTTVYFIERSLSLDNLFVFLLLFGYFGVPDEYRGRLLFWGIVFAIVLRGLAILGGVALVEQFHFVVYILAVALLVLAYRVFRSEGIEAEPGRNLTVRFLTRFLPVTEEQHGGRWMVRRKGRLLATPMFLCLAAVILTDIAFALDSIPAAFGITRDAFLIWMGNAFALLGMRALFVPVQELVERFRYLDETIAIMLALVAMKLLLEDVYKVGPEVSLGAIVLAFITGIAASVIAERRERQPSERRSSQRG